MKIPMNEKDHLSTDQVSAFLLEEFGATGNQEILNQYKSLVENFLALLEKSPIGHTLSLEKSFPASHMWALSLTMAQFLSKLSFFMIGQEVLPTLPD